MYLAKIDILTSKFTGTGIKNFDDALGLESSSAGIYVGASLLKTRDSSLEILVKFTATAGNVMF